MFGSGIFVFGTKIFEEEERIDFISKLPLELSWKILSYLDDVSLQSASKIWEGIIKSNKTLRSRVKDFELYIKYRWKRGSAFYKKYSKRLEKFHNNKLLNAQIKGGLTNHNVTRTKRNGDAILVPVKRRRIF